MSVSPYSARTASDATTYRPVKSARPSSSAVSTASAFSPSTVMFRIMSTTLSLRDGVCVPAPGTRPPPPPSSAPAAA